jgi:hypothetical protein
MPPDSGPEQSLNGPGDELYILAQRAMWAGDVAQCQRWLEQLLDLRGMSQSGSNVSPFDDPIGHSAFRLRLQNVRRLAEFGRLRAAAGSNADELSDDPQLLTSQRENIRATIFRLNERRFQMLGYVCDLSHDQTFYERIEKLSHDPRRRSESSDFHSSDAPVGDEDSSVALAYDRQWTIHDELFSEVTAGEFGNVLVDAIWTADELPDAADQLLDRFQKLIDMLD